MLSNFFILSSRGDTLVFRDYRGDTVKGAADIVYRKIKATKESLPPVFNVDGINYIFVKRNGLYFVCTTKFNISPALAVEVLSRVSNLCKDYCGVLNEESIKCNFPLIYELLDEILDFGYVQVTSTESLKAYVSSEPEVVRSSDDPLWQCSGGTVYGTEKMSLPSTAANKPVVLSKMSKKGSKSEVFVDLLERLTVLISANGNVLRSDIDGCIQMKSFVPGGAEVKISLNDEFFQGVSSALSPVNRMGSRLDNCTFHESVDLSNFDTSRTLVVNPPEGEFVVMQYRLSEEHHTSLPFTLISFVDEDEHSKTFEVVLKLRCNFASSSFANNIVLKLPVPKSSDSVTHNITVGTQSAEYKISEKAWYWNITKAQGGSEISAAIKIHLNEKRKSARKEVGPYETDLVVLIKRQYTPPKKTDETPAKKGTPPPKDSQFSLPRGLNPFPLLWAPALLPSMPFLSWQPSIPTAPSLCPTVCNNVHQLAHIQAGSGTHGSVSPFYPWQPSLGAFGGGAVTLSRSPASDMALRCGGLVFSHALSPRSSVQSPSCTECAASPSSTASVVSSSSPNVVIINNSLATSHNIPVDSTGVAGGNTYPKDTKATETKQPLPAQSNKASLLPGGTRKLKRVVADPLQSDLSERKTEVAAMGTVRTDTMRDSCSDKRCFQEEDHRFLVKKSKTDNKELTFLD